MKKIRNSLSWILVLTILISLAAPTALAVTTANGLKFASADPAYVSVNAGVTTLPQTFEATVSFPAGTASTTRGGVILGCYEGAGITCFNFEIKTAGNPRIYIIDSADEKTTYDVTFTNVNVYTGEPVHIAITYDNAAGQWYCYIDGALKQTIAKEAPAVFSMDKTLCLGGDLRSGNGQYFKGTIHNVAFYSDVRTAQEIAADAVATAATVDQNGLTHYYDLTGITAGDLPASVSSPIGKGPDFQKGKPGEDPNWWIYDKEPVTDYAYSFAIVGDPQIMNLNQPEKMAAMYQWIADNKEAKNIQYCLTMGDLTDKNTKAEYDRIEASFQKLEDAGLPYAFVRGNHDKEANFDTYMTYAEHGNQVAESGSFDGTMKNTWQKLTVGKVKYLFINVDYQNTAAELAPISTFISQNKDYNVIVSTHVYMGNNGKLLQDLRWEQDKNELAGVDLWDQMASKHDNIVLMLCGHAPSAKIVRNTNKNVNGLEIPQILVDCQDEDEKLGGLGMVAMFYFSEDGSKLQVEHYSVDRNAYYRTESQFSMELNTVNADGTINQVRPTTPNYSKVYKFTRPTVRNSSGVLKSVGLRDTVVSMLAEDYDAGYRNAKIEALHSGFNSTRSAAFNMDTTRLYMGYTAYAKNDPKWVAMRLRAPGAGTYELSITGGTVSETDLRTGTPMNAYLIPASQIPANATADTYSALRTDANKIGYYEFGKGNLTGSYGIHTLQEGDYILILEAAYPTKDTGWTASDNHANFLAVKSMELKTVVASIDNNMYTSLNAAFAAAQENDTVKLLQPYVGELAVPAGVALDLNGNRCTATDYVATNAKEYVTDSAGGGILVVDMLMLHGNNNGNLPLYDAKQGGYAFYRYTLTVPLADQETVESAVRFWYQLQFADSEAYDLIATGNTKLILGVDITWEGGALDATFEEDLPIRWAAAAKNNSSVWLYVDVTGLSNLGNKTLSLTPTLELAAQNFELTNGTMYYNK